MTIPENNQSLWANLEQLRIDSLTIMAYCGMAIGALWLILLIYPVTGTLKAAEPWIGSTLLIVVALISFMLKEHHAHWARHVYSWGILAVTVFAISAYRPSEITALLVLPIILASVLLGRRSVFMIAAASTVLTLIARSHYATAPLTAIDVIFPIGVIALVALASWLSVSNLYTTLVWFHDAYASASRNEWIARERQAELRQALKALDEATYSLERANYTLTLERNRADEARRLKQQFAQTISHELRTPLNLIVGFTELMTQSPEYYGERPSPAYMRDLSIVHRNALHLQTLVNDVLDLARIEAAQMTVLPEMTDPGELVRDAVETARSLVETRGLSLLTKIEPDLPPLWIDPTRIRQVLFNLLNNAARFTEQGSITVGVGSGDKEVVFSVADTGVGIAPKDIGTIFEEFQQVDGTTRRRHGGAGLGLTISRRFVELHSGRIWVESEVERGSTFSFSLPIARHDVGDHPIRRIPDSITNALPETWDRKRLLLAVTRSPSAATLLARYERGYHTVVVTDLEQAKIVARDLLPQGVIIDTADQKLDAESLQALAESWELPHIPFIACPLPGEELMRQQLLVNGYVIKPLSRQGLWEVLRPFGENIDRVLVIDDDQDFVRLLNRMLDSPQRRYQVINAYGGKEALILLRLHKPDLILLDLELPDFDPGQLIERIRREPAAKGTPIVVVSGQDAISNFDFINGPVMIVRPSGLILGQVLRWIQSVLDTTTQVQPAGIAG